MENMRKPMIDFMERIIAAMSKGELSQQEKEILKAQAEFALACLKGE